MKSFLQTKEWAEFQRAVGRPVFHYDHDGISAYIVRHDVSFGKNYLYIPHGPATIDQHFISFLKNLAREQKSFYVKMEPMDDSIAQTLMHFGFRTSRKELQPKRTVVLDVTKSEDELLAAMHHKTRYNIKVAEKHGIIARPSEDFETFWKLMEQTSKRDNFGLHAKNYYQKLLTAPGLKVDLILALKDERPRHDNPDHALAGAIMLTHGDTCYYLHGASDHAHRAMMAPYALHWGIIKYLKEQGIQYYDFWGVDARRYPGVTRFKLGWGGREIEYPGSFDLPISNFWYYMYKLVTKVI